MRKSNSYLRNKRTPSNSHTVHHDQTVEKYIFISEHLLFFTALFDLDRVAALRMHMFFRVLKVLLF